MDKKERERRLLERFKAITPLFPKGEIVDGKDDGTEADFIVVTNDGKRIGVELTELYRPSEPNKQPLQADESIRKQIIERACLIHKNWDGPPLDVCVFFSMNQEWRKQRVPEIAAKLAQIVFNNLPPEGESTWLENPWVNKTYFPFEIDLIDVRRHTWITEPHWHCPEASAIPELSSDRLQGVIDGKNDRITSYRQTTTEVWLVIVYDLGMSSWFDQIPETLKHSYVSWFNQTFLFNWFSQAVVKLSTNVDMIR